MLCVIINVFTAGEVGLMHEGVVFVRIVVGFFGCWLYLVLYLVYCWPACSAVFTLLKVSFVVWPKLTVIQKSRVCFLQLMGFFFFFLTSIALEGSLDYFQRLLTMMSSF